MKMKKILATMAASAISVSALAAMALTSNAAETTIAYKDNGTTANIDGLDGNSYRLNIYNIWGNDVKDIDADTAAVNDYIAVTFTVSGLGEQSANKNEDGSDADAYFAYLGGACGTNPDHHSKPTDEEELTAINGDGQYTVKWKLAEGSESISCLYVQTNINAYNLPEGNNFAIKVDSITTDDGVEPSSEETTEGSSEAEATSAEATTGESATTGAATTGAAATTGSAATTGAAATVASAATGDLGVGVAVAALAASVGVAFAVRKKD